MKRDHVNYLAAGATVLVALGLLFAVLYQITGQVGETDRYLTEYDRVAGIVFGTPVSFEGYRVGRVEAVRPLHDGRGTRFEVELSIQAGWPLPSDSVVTIASDGLLSEVTLDIRQGKNEVLAEPGDRLIGRRESDVFGAVASLAGEIERLTESELRPLVALVHERVDGITGELDRSTPVVMAQLQSLLGRLDESAAGLQQLLGNDNREAVATVLDNVEQLSGDSVILAAELRETRAELHSMVENLDAAIAENRPEVRQMVGRLAVTVDDLSLRIEAIGADLEDSARQFNEFTRAVRMRPNRLLFSPSDDVTEVER